MRSSVGAHTARLRGKPISLGSMVIASTRLAMSRSTASCDPRERRRFSAGRVDGHRKLVSRNASEDPPLSPADNRMYRILSLRARNSRLTPEFGICDDSCSAAAPEDHSLYVIQFHDAVHRRQPKRRRQQEVKTDHHQMLNRSSTFDQTTALTKYMIVNRPNTGENI